MCSYVKPPEFIDYVKASGLLLLTIFFGLLLVETYSNYKKAVPQTITTTVPLAGRTCTLNGVLNISAKRPNEMSIKKVSFKELDPKRDTLALIDCWGDANFTVYYWQFGGSEILVAEKKFERNLPVALTIKEATITGNIVTMKFEPTSLYFSLCLIITITLGLAGRNKMREIMRYHYPPTPIVSC